MSGLEAGSLAVAIAALCITLGQIATRHSVKGHLKRDLALIDALYVLLAEHLDKMDPDEMISCLDEIAGLKDDCGKLEKFTDNFFDRWNFRNRKLASKLTKKCKKVEHKCNAASSSALAAHCRTETNERKARLSSEKAVSVPGIKGASTADLLGLASEQVSTPNSSSMTGQQPLSDSPKASEPLLALGPEPMRGPESTYVPVTGCASDARTTHDDAEDLILLYKNLLDEPSDRNLATPALTPTLLRRDSPDPMLIRLNSNSAHQASVSHGEGSPSLQGFVPALVGGREAGVASTQVMVQRTYRTHIVRSPTQSFELADFKAATIISHETSREHVAKPLTGDQAYTGEQIFNMIHSAVAAGQYEGSVQAPQHSQSIRRPRRQRTTMSLASLD